MHKFHEITYTAYTHMYTPMYHTEWHANVGSNGSKKITGLFTHSGAPLRRGRGQLPRGRAAWPAQFRLKKKTKNEAGLKEQKEMEIADGDFDIFNTHRSKD